MEAHPIGGETKGIAVGDAWITGENLGGRSMRRGMKECENGARDKRGRKKNESRKRQRHRRSLEDAMRERQAHLKSSATAK